VQPFACLSLFTDALHTSGLISQRRATYGPRSAEQLRSQVAALQAELNTATTAGAAVVEVLLRHGFRKKLRSKQNAAYTVQKGAYLQLYD
jgi:hypothetical protein